MSRRVKIDRYRTFHQAAVAWKGGYPHQAWEIVMTAGLGAHWGQFMAEILRQARRDYEVSIERYFV